MEVSSFVILYFRQKIFVRFSQVSIEKRCPLIMKVKLRFSAPGTGMAEVAKR